MDSIPHHAVRAKAMRHAAGESIITLANRLSVPGGHIFRMERGDAGFEHVARQIVGHYWGRRNERQPQSEIGRRLRALRHEAGHTATQLAALMGTKPHSVWNVESRPDMSRKMCLRIAEFYGVPASELEAA